MPPSAQVARQRTFFKLKYIRNRLRSALTQDHLETFMLLSVESDIILMLMDNVLIINKMSQKSLHLNNYKICIHFFFIEF